MMLTEWVETGFFTAQMRIPHISNCAMRRLELFDEGAIRFAPDQIRSDESRLVKRVEKNVERTKSKTKIIVTENNRM